MLQNKNIKVMFNDFEIERLDVDNCDYIVEKTKETIIIVEKIFKSVFDVPSESIFDEIDGNFIFIKGNYYRSSFYTEERKNKPLNATISIKKLKQIYRLKKLERIINNERDERDENI